MARLTAALLAALAGGAAAARVQFAPERALAVPVEAALTNAHAELYKSAPEAGAECRAETTHGTLMPYDPEASLGGKANLCPTCVSFAQEATQQLVSIAEKVGIGATCTEVCLFVPPGILQEVCGVACEFAGVELFIKALDHADLDPFFFCELINICPVTADGAISDAKVLADPNPVKQGTDLTVTFTFTVDTPTGSGEIGLVVVEKSSGKAIIGAGSVHPSFAAGPTGVQWKISTSPTSGSGRPIMPGEYTMEALMCQGECGSKHPHSVMYGVAVGNFTVTA